MQCASAHTMARWQLVPCSLPPLDMRRSNGAAFAPLPPIPTQVTHGFGVVVFTQALVVVTIVDVGHELRVCRVCHLWVPGRGHGVATEL